MGLLQLPKKAFNPSSCSRHASRHWRDSVDFESLSKQQVLGQTRRQLRQAN